MFDIKKKGYKMNYYLISFGNNVNRYLYKSEKAYECGNMVFVPSKNQMKLGMVVAEGKKEALVDLN